MVKRIISFFLVSVIFFSCCAVTSHADVIDAGDYYVSNLWDALQGNGFDWGAEFWNNITGYFVGKECPSSPDSYHHGPKPVFGSSTGGTDEDGRYSLVTCNYCGKQFKAYSSFAPGHGGGFSSDLQQSYDTQVSELPATSYDSDGRLRFLLTVKSFSAFNASQIIYSKPGAIFEVAFKKSGSSSSGYTVKGFFDEFKAPIAGVYQVAFTFIDTPVAYKLSDFAPTSLNNHPLGTYMSFEGGPGIRQYLIPKSASYGLGETILSDSDYFVLHTLYSEPPGQVTGYWEALCTPYGTSSGNTYSINSRPGVMLGMYGDVNGNAFSNNSLSIVNETNNTYTNPATGETHTLSDWSYNYTDRSYTVTTETGDTVTITYGDENVTIIEGGTTYNIYYLLDGSGTVTPGPGPDTPTVCDHTWTETSRTDPTCSTVGKAISQCSKCGQTKTETIPAAGHSWAVDRIVQTTYDEEGNLLQQGYTIYSCAVCGEQYKDMQGTGPPGAEEEKSIWEKIGDFFGTIGGGIIDIIGAILNKLLDALIALAEMLMDKLKTVVETILSIFDELPALFGGFLDFLSAIFPFLPPEIMTILTFGVIAIVFIGILKAVRR